MTRTSAQQLCQNCASAHAMYGGGAANAAAYSGAACVESLLSSHVLSVLSTVGRSTLTPLGPFHNVILRKANTVSIITFMCRCEIPT